MYYHDLYIPEQDLRKLLAAASGDSALLYLYLQGGGHPEGAQAALRFAPQQMEYAAASLNQMGLWPQEPQKALRPAEPPVYSEEDLIRHQRQDIPFQRLVGETQRRLGKLLSTEELKILLSFYDYLGLPAEVVSILVSYCIQRARVKGSQRLPSMRIIEREAYHWSDLGIDTLEEAAAYMQSQLDRQSKAGRIRQILQITDRKLTPGEERMVLDWLDWGFGEDVIARAYEKTCMNTGGLKWPYLHSILKSWHEQGLHTLQAVEAGDKTPGRQAAPQRTVPSQRAKDAVARILQSQEE